MLKLKLKHILFITLGLGVVGLMLAFLARYYLAYEHPLITIDAKENVFLYKPRGYLFFKRYPVLVALHGKRESAQGTCDTWKPVSDHYGFILLCPGGSDFEEAYIRAPIDDRKRIRYWLDYVHNEYKTKSDQTLLAGFSRGGNIALELGLSQPKAFPQVLCLFGFFNASLIKKSYKISSSQKLCLITGKGDPSYDSMMNAFDFLKQKKISARIYVYDTLKHSYPKPLVDEMKEVFLFLKGF